MSTLKQKALAQKIMENNGKRPVTELMVESGYGPGTARGNQKRIQQGIGFIEILEQAGATNKFIAKGLMRGATAMNGKKIDHNIRHRYLETIMKAKKILNDAEGSGLGLISEYLESLKGFDLEFMVAIKTRIAKGSDVTTVA